LEEAYAHGWVEIMAVLDASDSKRAEITEPLNALWRARTDTAWALRIAAIQDETVLSSLALLIPELEAIAGGAERETGDHLHVAIERLRAADRIIEEPVVEGEPEETPSEETAETAPELEVAHDAEPLDEEWSDAEGATVALAGDHAESGPQLDLFARRPEADALQLPLIAVELPAVADEGEEAQTGPEESASERSQLDDGSFYDLESVAPRPYAAVLPSYARLLEKVSDFLRVQVHRPLADDIDAIDSLADDFDLEDDDSETSSVLKAEPPVAAQTELPSTEIGQAEPAALVEVAEPEPPPSQEAGEPESIPIVQSAQPEPQQAVEAAVEPFAVVEATPPELLPLGEVLQAEPEPPAEITEADEQRELVLAEDAFVIATSDSKSEPVDELPPMVVAEAASAEAVLASSAPVEEPLVPPAETVEPYLDKLDEVGSNELEEHEGAGKLSHAEAMLADGDDDTGLAPTAETGHPPPAADAPKTIASPAAKTASDPFVDAALSFS
jgi:hypothetical protein